MKRLGLAFLFALACASTASALLWIQPSRFAGGGGGGGGPLVVSSAQGLGAGSQTTTGIDTTGSNLIVLVALSYLSENTPTDNKGNTYTGLSTNDGASSLRLRMYYCAAPTVGSGHTFSTTSTYGADFIILAFSSMSGTPLDQQSMNAGSGTTLSPGSITTSQANTILVTSSAGLSNAASSISDSITIQSTTGITSVGYKVLTATTTINPTWTWGASQSDSVTKIASFKY